MRRFLIVLAAVLGMIVPSACGGDEPEEVEQVDLKELLFANSEVKKGLAIDSKAMKMRMKYDLYLPPKFDSEKAYPILYLLHGAGDDQDAWLDKGDAQKIADNYIKNQGGTPMIIVMPDAQLTFYRGNYEQYLHEELMPEVEGKYKFSGKRAVAGLSMGGFGTLLHALKYPTKFTYAYAMSPAIADTFKDLVDAQPNKSVFPTFTIEVGNQDTTVDNSAAKDLADYMKGKGLSVEFIARDGIHYWNFWQECLPKALKKAGDSFK
ncbi:MAG: esterase family protein [Bacteroidales bacterium]|nr:esterase family protein [Bacteroidales bacterium]